MTDIQTYRSPTTNEPGQEKDRREIGQVAGDAVTLLTHAAQDAGKQARDAATSLVSEASEGAKRIMNKQVGLSADFISTVARSVHVGASHLDSNAPQLAEMARGVASRAEDFSRSIHDQTVEELFVNASDYARRKPELVFGLAAACGFVLFRLFKASPPANGLSSSQEPAPRYSGSYDGE